MKYLTDRLAHLGFLLFIMLWRVGLSLRYRIEVREHSLDLNEKTGILFLPNHPALIDPPILFSQLWPKFQVRPLVVEHMYRNPLLRYLMKMTDALPIPGIKMHVNPLKIKKINDVNRKIVEELKQGDHFVIYPAGHLKSEGREVLGGASGVHSLIRECPDVNIVLIRTSGLWGSCFSRAPTGKTPDLGKVILHVCKVLWKNCFFFALRRKVLVEIEKCPADFPRNASRLEFNRYLENWYNRYPDEQGNLLESEPLRLVPYHVWSKNCPQILPSQKTKSLHPVAISNETRDKLYREMRRILKNPSLAIQPEMSLSSDLGMDSLDIADLISCLLKNYDVEDLCPNHLETVQDVLEIASGEKVIRAESLQQSAPFHWPSEKGRPDPEIPTGNTLPEAFLHICQKKSKFAACADPVSGVFSYRRIKKRVLVLAEYFRTLPEERIAVLLPSSVGVYITVLALQFAGKVPVLLNWTLGPRYLEEMMQISGAKQVITSWRFIDHLSHVDFGNLIDQMLLLEDIRDNLSLKMKIRGQIRAHSSMKTVLRSLPLDANKDCVILFTSGSEASPKAVPLSHHNLLASIRATAPILHCTANDVGCVALPPFHSFGFIATGMLALLTGTKTVFYPDPTDGSTLSSDFEKWGVSIYPAAPNLLKRVFSVAHDAQLKSLRLFILGGEKPSPEIVNHIKNLGDHVQFIDGYGITECSAAIAMTRPGSPAKGVGKLLEHFEACVIHPETGEILPKGVEGEICVRGPSVFNRYLGDVPSPFIDLQGTQWYRTGDLGYFDPDDFLFLSGRLKRCTKLGGEMISLGAVEEALVSALLEQGAISPDVPSLAVCEDASQLVLFSIVPIEKEVANDILRAKGFSNLIKISAVKKIDEIPLFGTGKTDYRRLQNVLRD